MEHFNSLGKKCTVLYSCTKKSIDGMYTSLSSTNKSNTTQNISVSKSGTELGWPMTSSDLRRNFEIHTQSEHKDKSLLTKKRRMSEPRTVPVELICNWKQWMLFSVPGVLGCLIFVLKRLAAEEQLIIRITAGLCLWMNVWKIFFLGQVK